MTYTNWDIVEERQIFPDHKGIFARRPIREGEVIGVYDGEVRAFEIVDGKLKDPSEHRFIVQLHRSGDTLFGLYKTEALEGVCFINHSCHPNIVPIDRVVLAAREPIAAGEALTIDYTKWDFVGEGLQCWCVPPLCVI